MGDRCQTAPGVLVVDKVPNRISARDSLTPLGMKAQRTLQKEPKGRLEDRRLLTGKGTYVDDVRFDGQAYMGLVRSPYAHARITNIDFSAVRSSPLFLASLTGDDLVKEGLTPVMQNPWPFQRPARRYHLAVGKVRFVGEPVAAILVTDKSSVEDLLEQVRVDYDPLPAVTTIEEAKKREVLVYDDWKDNLSLTSEVKKGDAEEAIASADFVVTLHEGIARQVAAPIEPRAVAVSYDKGQDLYEVWATVQSVHGMREKLAHELKTPQEKFHVRVMDMGGGFGSKGAQSYPEPPLACIFSKKTGLPVKWTASRMEEFLEGAAGRDEYCEITLACDKQGRMVAVKARVECDSGVTGTQVHMPSMTIETMLGPYGVANQDLVVAAYATNKMPLGPVRGAGGPEGCYFIERAVDALAKKAGIDPIRFRRINVTRRKSKADSREDYAMLIDTLVRSSHYEELLKWRGDVMCELRRDGGHVVVGIGVSITGSDDAEQEEEGDWGGAPEEGDGGASEQWKKEGEESGGRHKDEDALDFMSESGRVKLDKEGNITVYTGSSPHGQGEETTFAQLASQELGFPLEKVTVVWGDTRLIPRGVGTYGSRSATTGGSAVVDASRKLRSEVVGLASKVTGVDAGLLDIRDGKLVDRSSSRQRMPSWEAILEKLDVDEFSASSIYTLPASDYSSGVQLCALTLDIEQGEVKVVKYFVVEDCGRMINKAIVEGQLQGGIVHGIGGALFEGLDYDENGNLLNPTFMDYNIPTALDSPDVSIFHVVNPSTVTLDGAKGMGESGTNAAYAAVMNAVNDALSQVKPGKMANIAPATRQSLFAILSSGEHKRRPRARTSNP